MYGFISEADRVVLEHVCQHDMKQGIGMSDKFPVASQLRPIAAKQSNSNHMMQKKVAPFIASLRERVTFVFHIPVCKLDFFHISTLSGEGIRPLQIIIEWCFNEVDAWLLQPRDQFHVIQSVLVGINLTGKSQAVCIAVSEKLSPYQEPAV